MNTISRHRMEALARKGNLVGHFFHSLTADEQIEWQGVILSRPKPGWYLVQLFEWFMGEPSVRKLVPFEQMTNWFFYATNEEMKFSADYGTARRGGPYRKDTRSNSDVATTA